MKKLWSGFIAVCFMMLLAIPVFAVEQVTFTMEQQEQFAEELEKRDMGSPEEYTVAGMTWEFSVYAFFDPELTGEQLSERSGFPDYLILKDGEPAGICWFYDGIDQRGYCFIREVDDDWGTIRSQLMLQAIERFGNGVMYCMEDRLVDDPSQDGCLIFDPDTPNVFYRFRLSDGIDQLETLDFDQIVRLNAHEYIMADHEHRAPQIKIFYDQAELKSANRYFDFRWWYDFWYGLWYGGKGVATEYVYGLIAAVIAAVILIKRQIKRVKEREQ